MFVIFRKYSLIYTKLFGGVTAFTQSQFESINGYYNLYFGWGGEDDDIFDKVHRKSLNISRSSMKIGRYIMLNHKRDEKSSERISLLRSSHKRSGRDGINSLPYKIIKVIDGKWFKRVVISLTSTQPLVEIEVEI